MQCTNSDFISLRFNALCNDKWGWPACLPAMSVHVSEIGSVVYGIVNFDLLLPLPALVRVTSLKTRIKRHKTVKKSVI